MQQELESLSGRQNAHPQICSRLIPRACECYLAAKEFADVIKNLSRWKDYPGLSSWECNHITDYNMDTGEGRGKARDMRKQRLE